MNWLWALLGIILILRGSDGYTIYHGLYGDKSVLGAIVIGRAFSMWQPGSRICMPSCAQVVTATLLALLAPFGIPTITAAFVFSTWLFVIPKSF